MYIYICVHTIAIMNVYKIDKFSLCHKLNMGNVHTRVATPPKIPKIT